LGQFDRGDEDRTHDSFAVAGVAGAFSLVTFLCLYVGDDYLDFFGAGDLDEAGAELAAEE
jgi:hypothetical protein